MRFYTLPEPDDFERRLLRCLAGSTKAFAAWKTFPSGETHVRVEGVEPRVGVIGRIRPPAENLWRTLLLIDTLRRNGAKKIDLVLPYFAYARQDRQVRPGDPVSAGCVLRLLAAAGASRVITVDLHGRRTLESSPLPIVSVTVIPELAAALADDLRGRKFTVVSADRGGRERADNFARALGREDGAVWIEKKRDSTGGVTAKRLVGRLTGDTAVIVDDMLDTGGTIVAAARLLRQRGCRHLYLAIVHPVFSAGAVALVRKLKFEKIALADAYPVPSAVKRLGQVVIASVVGRLAEAVGLPVNDKRRL